MKAVRPVFNVGDRVKLARPSPGTFAQTFGQVVNHFGEHNPKMPRVRWVSGWGTSTYPKDLTLCTPEEAAANPVRLCEVDLQPPFDAKAELARLCR